VPALLRLIQGAIEAGCSQVYDSDQRRAVFLSYATTLFIDTAQPIEIVIAEEAGRPLGVAELDTTGRLRALFVAAEVQGRGVGTRLLSEVETLARDGGLDRIQGAMSLNAERFYARAGYVRFGQPHVIRPMGTPVRIIPMQKQLRRLLDTQR
jgi:GNAT superfamily N-acetyltransferase